MWHKKFIQKPKTTGYIKTENIKHLLNHIRQLVHIKTYI